MSRPFLVIGAMKSGTTTLEAVLDSHSDVELVAEKEATTFSRPERAGSVARDMQTSMARAAGEVSTAYMQSPAIPVDPASIANLFTTEPLHVLAVLREPYARARSHWRHWDQLGRNATGDPSDLLCDPEGPYVAFSSYFRQLRPWIDACGQQRVLPMRLEDYERDPATWVQRVFSFLNVPGPAPTDALSVHLNGGSGRVVARGFGAKVAQSSLYRKTVRPYLPSSLRSGGALALGGQRGGGERQGFDDVTRARFMRAVDSDMASLKQIWPELTWGDA